MAFHVLIPFSLPLKDTSCKLINNSLMVLNSYLATVNRDVRAQNQTLAKCCLRRLLSAFSQFVAPSLLGGVRLLCLEVLSPWPTWTPLCPFLWGLLLITRMLVAAIATLEKKTALSLSSTGSPSPCSPVHSVIHSSVG